MRGLWLVVPAICLCSCVERYQPPDEGIATLVTHLPSSFQSRGIIEVLVYPEGCPVAADEQGLLVGRVYGRRNSSKPRAFEIVGDQRVFKLRGDGSALTVVELSGIDRCIDPSEHLGTSE